MLLAVTTPGHPHPKAAFVLPRNNPGAPHRFLPNETMMECFHYSTSLTLLQLLLKSTLNPPPQNHYIALTTCSHQNQETEEISL